MTKWLIDTYPTFNIDIQKKFTHWLSEGNITVINCISFIDNASHYWRKNNFEIQNIFCQFVCV